MKYQLQLEQAGLLALAIFGLYSQPLQFSWWGVGAAFSFTRYWNDWLFDKHGSGGYYLQPVSSSVNWSRSFSHWLLYTSTVYSIGGFNSARAFFL